MDIIARLASAMKKNDTLPSKTCQFVRSGVSVSREFPRQVFLNGTQSLDSSEPVRTKRSTSSLSRSPTAPKYFLTM